MSGHESTSTATQPWQDQSVPMEQRVEFLIENMSLSEKISQLVGLWVGPDSSSGGVAPYQSDMTKEALVWEDVIADGLGQLTRPFGTAPVDPTTGANALANSQHQIMDANRWRIPALVHEECLAGFAAWKATAYPIPLTWGATFNPELIAQMTRHIGGAMHTAGVHQGLAPVLDVTRDYRWGRTEETISEDPYLVGTIATAYVKGLQEAGLVATLKHFAGYSASRAARNLAPVSIGPLELADVILPPFEMALMQGDAQSVMHSYTDLDGVPSAADEDLLTGLLRDTWGFTGTVVADYFGVGFLHKLHGVAGTEAEAAHLALRAGVDVELPTVHCYGQPLRDAVENGEIDIALIDRALRRVLIQKAELGLLDAEYDPYATFDGDLSFDDEHGGDLALQIAREGVVLLSNDGLLPLDLASEQVAVIGPRADDALSMLGCYSFPAHVGVKHEGLQMGIDISTVRQAIADATGGRATFAAGCGVTGDDTSGFDEAVRIASEASVAVLAVGDSSGLFGRGTSGEGCDAADLHLPGVQEDLIKAVLDTGTPVILVLLTGRPYAIGEFADRAAATIQGFFPGQKGAQAITEIITGAINPSGRLPLGIPRHAGAQPGTYLTAMLGAKSGVSNIDPTPVFAFGHGLSYTSFDWDGAAVSTNEVPIGSQVEVTVEVTNSGQRDGVELVQLYLHDPVAKVARPVQRLIGYARVPLAAGESTRVAFTVHTDIAAYSIRGGRRIVDLGALELRLGKSEQDIVAALPVTFTGTEADVDHTRTLSVPVSLTSQS